VASLLTLIVVTFNLLHGGPWSEWTGEDQQLERRLEIAAAELERLRPDVIALQEASVGWRRGNVAARLAGRLGMHYAHEPATERVFGIRALGWLVTRLIGFREGPAILSRYPIVESEAIDLPRCRKRYDPRVLLAATVRTPGGDMIVYSTHTSRDDCQVARIAELVQRRRNGLPSIVMGDFNTGDTTAPVERMRAAGFVDAFRAANPDGQGATVWQPIDATTRMASRRVDYIFVLPGHAIDARVPESRVVLDTPRRERDGATLWPSDHHGVLAAIALVPKAN
jgi:endonuclease/exonuclease/phosphatase family metal-dependent hydrolase